MVELQIAHRKSNLVFSARFPVVKDVGLLNLIKNLKLKKN